MATAAAVEDEDGSSLALVNIALSLACPSAMPAASAAPKPKRPTTMLGSTAAGSADLATISTLGVADAGSGGLLRNADISPFEDTLVMLEDLPKLASLADVPRPGVGGNARDDLTCGEAAFASEAGDKSRCSRKTLLSLECFGRGTLDL